MAQRLSYWLFFNSVSEQHFPVLPPPPKLSSWQLHQLGLRDASEIRVRAAWVSGGHTGGSGRLGLSSVWKWLWQALYQLALTASISLTRFWARQIPKICSKAMPMKIPATMVKLSCNHFSNWGTQPFV